MKLIEMHILQSFPVTCLNRDDVGAPKTAFFGGCQRARVSSQSWKRAIRLHAQELEKESGLHLFEGVRTRKAADDLAERLKSVGMKEEEAKKIASEVCEGFLKKRKTGKEKKAVTDEEPDNQNGNEPTETSTLLYFSPAELVSMAEAIVKKKEEKGVKADLGKAAAAAVPNAQLKDAADIAVFGRMVAAEPSLTLEGAGLFSHALATHRTDLDIDFFTAVEDRKQPGDDAGSAMMGTLEFNSACYYRYVGLNLDMLFDKDHLAILKPDERIYVLKTFFHAVVEAVPSARKNTMFGWNPPAYVLGLKRTGQPLSLVNAFENPIRAKNGFVEESIEALKRHWEKLSGLYELKAEKAELPPDSLNTLINKLI